MNKDLMTILAHPSKRISDSIKGDPNIVNLTVGEPAYGPPSQVINALMKQLSGRKEYLSNPYDRYADSRGLQKLREAIAKYYKRLYDVNLDPDSQVVITHGAAEAIWLTIYTLTNPGDEVIIPNPAYILYEPITKSLGRKPIRLAAPLSESFQITEQNLKKVISKNTRLLILNSPDNPTGTIYDKNTISAILSLAYEYGFHVMHDEVFDSIVYKGEYISSISIDRDVQHTILVNSFSKRFGMTGWRLGWLIASAPIVAQATKAHSYMSLATGTLVQHAVADALNDSDVINKVASDVKSLYDRGYQFYRSLCDVGGFSFPSGFPQGGFYLFPNIKDLQPRLPQTTPTNAATSEKIADQLLQICNVAVVPGTSFGSAGEHHVRISFAAPKEQLDVAVGRFYSAL